MGHHRGVRALHASGRDRRAQPRRGGGVARPARRRRGPQRILRSGRLVASDGARTAEARPGSSASSSRSSARRRCGSAREEPPKRASSSILAASVRFGSLSTATPKERSRTLRGRRARSVRGCWSTRGGAGRPSGGPRARLPRGRADGAEGSLVRLGPSREATPADLACRAVLDAEGHARSHRTQPDDERRRRQAQPRLRTRIDGRRGAMTQRPRDPGRSRCPI